MLGWEMLGGRRLRRRGHQDESLSSKERGEVL